MNGKSLQKLHSNMFIQDDTFNNFPKMYTRHDYCSASTIRDTRVYGMLVHIVIDRTLCSSP